MKDQIKIQVSDDGLFGTPVNKYDALDDMMKCIDFHESHPLLPLTTPQIPKSMVMGEEEHVWQFKSNLTAEWLDGKSKESVMRLQHLGWEIREAYKVITPVPNSEPKETVDETNLNTVACGYADSILLELNSNNTDRNRIYQAAKDDFINGANWQAQQQPVSKSEWISVVHPPNIAKCFIAYKFGVAEAAYSENTKTFWDTRYEFEFIEVTHWQPLPQPPVSL